MERSLKLTQVLCKALMGPGLENRANEWVYSDTTVQGLKFSVTKSGRRSFHFRYSFLGDKGFIKIGRFPATSLTLARKTALGFITHIDQGIDPKGQRILQREMPTCSEFIADYFVPYARVKRSFKADESKLRIYINPSFGGLRLSDVTEMHVRHYLTEKSESLSKATANRHRALLSSIFKLAVSCKFIATNPCQGTKKFLENPPPPRYLDDDEVGRILLELPKDENPVAAAALEFLLMTGLRLGEVLNARWSDVDLIHAQYFLPTTKGGASRYVPLNPVALRILNNQQKGSGSFWVFPGKDPQKPLKNIRKAWQRVLARAGVEPIRIHDIRHSFASACVRRGVPLYTVQKLLGHASHATTQRYAHLNQDELRQASLTAVEGYLKPVN